MKKYTLTSLTGCPGSYTATLYCADNGGYWIEKRFLWYSKRDMFYLLRNKYDCIVPHKFY